MFLGSLRKEVLRVLSAIGRTDDLNVRCTQMLDDTLRLMANQGELFVSNEVEQPKQEPRSSKELPRHCFCFFYLFNHYFRSWP